MSLENRLHSKGYVKMAAGSIDAAAALVVPTGATRAWISAEAQAIRWRDDGTNPTATDGYPLAAGAELKYDGVDLPKLKVISQVAGAILHVQFFGE